MMTEAAGALYKKIAGLFIAILMALFVLAALLYFSLSGPEWLVAGKKLEYALLMAFKALPYLTGMALLSANLYALAMHQSGPSKQVRIASVREFFGGIVIINIAISLLLFYIAGVLLPSMNNDINLLSRDTSRFVIEEKTIPQDLLREGMDLFYAGLSADGFSSAADDAIEKFRLQHQYRVDLFNQARKQLGAYLEGVDRGNRIALLYRGAVDQQLAVLAEQQRLRQQYRTELRQFREGLELYFLGRYGESAELFSRVLRPLPNHPPARTFIERIRKEREDRTVDFLTVNKGRDTQEKLENVLQTGIELYQKSEFKEALSVFSNLQAFDRWNDTTQRYMDMTRAELEKVTFFVEEFDKAALYPRIYGIFLPLGDNLYLAADTMYRRDASLLFHRMLLVELTTGGEVRDMSVAEYGKFQGRSIMMRQVRRSTPASLRMYEEHLHGIPFDFSPELLWNAAGFMQGIYSLPPGSIQDMIRYFAQAGLPDAPLRLELVRLFMLPVVVFALALFCAGLGWRRRVVRRQVSVWIRMLLFFVFPLIMLFFMLFLLRFVLGLQAFVSDWPVLAYVAPVLFSLLLIGSSLMSVLRQR